MLFVADDWAEDHHDVEIQDETGRRLAKARLPERITGIAKLDDLIGRFLPEGGDADTVKIGIETDRGPWVAALVASGYRVYGAVKVLTRMHQSLIWDRTRQVLRLRSSLRGFFPSALEAYEDLAFPDVLELLAKAPDPDSAARLTRAQVTAALARARRRDRETKTTAIMLALREEHLT